ncbi:MAG: helix-turn-helix domain-containing protein [Enterocloster sp.]
MWRETAQALCLHRNTLQYRFNQIKELTGFDIRRIDDMILLAAGGSPVYI